MTIHLPGLVQLLRCVGVKLIYLGQRKNNVPFVIQIIIEYGYDDFNYFLAAD
jgi:hypothetical protein